MSLPYRGHGPGLIGHAFDIYSLAANTLFGHDADSHVACTSKRLAVHPQIKLDVEKEMPTLPALPKTHFMSLPAEIRAIILRHLLGDRKVHAHYEQRVTHDSCDGTSEEAHTEHFPQYSFCCDRHYRAAARRRGDTIKRKSYEERHVFCYKQPGGMKHVIGPLPQTLEVHQVLECINDSRWSRSFTDRLSILMVSKLLRREALEAFYSTNIFSFGDLGSFNTFFRRIDLSRAALLRKIELSTTIEWDTRLASEYGIYVSSGFPVNWIFECPDNLLVLQKQAKLANVTDIIVRVHDNIPVVRADPKGWKAARELRLSRLDVWLGYTFMGFGLLTNMKKAKVRIVCAADVGNHQLCSQAQRDFELDQDALRVVEDKYERELVSGSGLGAIF